MKNLLLITLMNLLAVVSVNGVPKHLVEKLDADEFAIRTKAHKDLMRWVGDAKKDDIRELKKVYQGTESPEIKTRLFDILNTRGFVGITMDAKVGGVGILRVERNTPAEKIDLRVGDLIIEVDNQDLTQKKANVDEATQFFSSYVKSKNAGQKLDIKIKRNGEILKKSLRLGDYDKFNEAFLQQNPQFLLQERNLRQIRPRAQFRIDPEIVRPRAQLEPLEIEELNKMMELRQKGIEERRKKADTNKKELKKLELELKKK